MQTATASQYKPGRTYINHSPSLKQALKDQEGTFEVAFNGQSFLVTCQEGHSIEDVIPNGTKNVWLITRQQEGQIVETEEDRARARSAGA